jgi:hypothetical protein
MLKVVFDGDIFRDIVCLETVVAQLKLVLRDLVTSRFIGRARLFQLLLPLLDSQNSRDLLLFLLPRLNLTLLNF